MSVNLSEQVCFNFYTGWRAVTAIYKDIYGQDITPQNIFTLKICDLNKQITMTELSKSLE